MRQWLANLRLLLAALRPVPWTCQYCQMDQSTPYILWHSVRYQLICRGCGCMQNYPEYVRTIDPEPTGG